MAFKDIRFPDDISYGAVGGPGFNTDVVEYGGGNTQRNANWGDLALCEYDVAHAARIATQFDRLLAFFRIVRGMADSFRYKDWMDYQCLAADGLLGTTGVGTGALQYQAYKTYTFDSESVMRKLVLLVSGTVVAYRNGLPVIVGVAAGNVAFDILTGLFTFVPDVTKNVNANVAKTISGITQANPGVVNATGHGFNNGDKIKHTGVGGMTQVNNLYFTVTVVDADHYSIGVDTTAYGAYTSGGTATKCGITQTNPPQVNSTGHGFSNGQLIWASAAAGMTQINGAAYAVANATTDRFELSGIDASAFSAYTGSGVMSKGPQPADTLTVACEFDVKANFNIDKLRGAQIKREVFGWSGIPIMEQR